MGNGSVIMIIGTECSPEWEEEWSKWYSEKHLPDIFYSCNAKKATRYKIKYLEEGDGIALTANERSREAGYAPYLAVYEFDNWEDVKGYYACESREAIVEEWNRDWASKGARIVWRIFYEPIKTWVKQTGVGDKPAIMVIGTECPPEWEGEWSEWYANKHIPDFIKSFRVNRATRYKLKTPTEDDRITPTQDERTGKVIYAPYLAIYDFDSWEAIEEYYGSELRPELVEDWNKNWGALKEIKVLWRIFYELIKTWEK